MLAKHCLWLEYTRIPEDPGNSLSSYLWGPWSWCWYEAEVIHREKKTRPISCFFTSTTFVSAWMILTTDTPWYRMESCLVPVSLTILLMPMGNSRYHEVKLHCRLSVSAYSSQVKFQLCARHLSFFKLFVFCQTADSTITSKATGLRRTCHSSRWLSSSTVPSFNRLLGLFHPPVLPGTRGYSFTMAGISPSPPHLRSTYLVRVTVAISDLFFPSPLLSLTPLTRLSDHGIFTVGRASYTH